MGPAGALSVAALALPLLLWIEPVLETFEFGQVNLILMGLVAVDCLAPRTRWPRGLLVGLAAAIKLTPAAFVLFFLLRRDMRAAVVTVVTAAVATGIGFAVDAGSSARYWFGGPASGVSGSVFYTNQTSRPCSRAPRCRPWPATAGVVRGDAGAACTDRPGGAPRRPALALVTVAGFALLVSRRRGRTTGCGSRPRCWSPCVEAVRRRSRGWAAAIAVLAVTFYVAPFRFLPHEQDQELTWSATQQVVGATYVIVGILALVAVRIAVARPDRAPVAATP